MITSLLNFKNKRTSKKYIKQNWKEKNIRNSENREISKIIKELKNLKESPEFKWEYQIVKEAKRNVKNQRLSNQKIKETLKSKKFKKSKYWITIRIIEYSKNIRKKCSKNQTL